MDSLIAAPKDALIPALPLIPTSAPTLTASASASSLLMESVLCKPEENESKFSFVTPVENVSPSDADSLFPEPVIKFRRFEICSL